MSQQPPVAFVVTLHPGASETEASVVRNALREMRCVASVQPVQSNPAQEAARAQAKTELREEVLPVWAEVCEVMKGTLEAKTEEFMAIINPGREAPLDVERELARLRPAPVQDLPRPRPATAAPQFPLNPNGTGRALR